MDDQELLRRCMDEASENAFRPLVERRGGFVQSVANETPLFQRSYFKAALSAFFILYGIAQTSAAADVAGTWAMYAMDHGEMTDATRLELTANGSAVTGKGKGLILNGTLNGADLNLAATREDRRLFGTFEIHG